MKSATRYVLLPLSGLLVSFAVVAISSPAEASGFDVYLSAPGSQQTLFTSTLTETFSGFSTGTYTSNLVSTIGTYQLTTTAKAAIVANNQYGTGTGNYFSIGAQSSSSAPVTLQLSGQNSYFGFSWNAGDVNNELSFYNGSTLVGYYKTAAILDILKNATVTAVNGQTYQSSSYFGQPGTQLNASEPYAFINFFDSTGSFDRIVFGNSGSSGTGFESDNHTIRTTAPAPDSTFVFVGSAVPEPGDIATVAGLGLAGGIFLKRRLRRSRRTVSAAH